MKIAFAVIVLLALVIIGYFETQPTKPTSTPSEQTVALPVPLNKEQAMAIIAELPEIKAWSDYIERTSDGKAHGMIMEPPAEVTLLDGKQYWSVGFYENQPAQSHRWESFLVGLDHKDIWVDDIEEGFISLQTWRDTKKPMARID